MSGISNHEFISFFGTEENEDIQKIKPRIKPRRQQSFCYTVPHR